MSTVFIIEKENSLPKHLFRTVDLVLEDLWHQASNVTLRCSFPAPENVYLCQPCSWPLAQAGLGFPLQWTAAWSQWHYSCGRGAVRC